MAALHTHHPVALRGPSPLRPGAPALLVDVQADDFATALAAGLKATAWPRFGWPQRLPFDQLAAMGAVRALYQPIHRRFNLVLLDTHCAAFGAPRLDPRKIESSGFVVRRWVGPDPASGMPDATAISRPEHWQAWIERDGEAAGWQRFASQQHFDADPDPARRATGRTGNPVIDAALEAQGSAWPAEAGQRLYPLPPDVCTHARRTLLYGLVPASEAQRTRSASVVDYSAMRAPGPARDDFVAHLSPYLRPAAGARTLPAGGTSFDSTWLADEQALEADAPEPSSEALRRAQFTAFIRQLALEFDVGAGAGQSLEPLLDELQIVRILRSGPTTTRAQSSARAFILACVRVVREKNAPAVTMPDEWLAVPTGWTNRFVAGALAVLESRSAQSSLLQGRFDDAEALYSIRAFVRVKDDPACPPRLVWSEMSPLYRIAPWHASTGSPQARIALPPLTAQSLRSMKPNVAFELPPELQSLLARNSPKSLLEGKAGQGSEIGLSWLCSFSIPIITICAFIALNIILSLLDFVLRWMPLVKICLPIPRKR